MPETNIKIKSQQAIRKNQSLSLTLSFKNNLGLLEQFQGQVMQ